MIGGMRTWFLFFFSFALSINIRAQYVHIKDDEKTKQITFNNEKISGIIDYDQKVNISLLIMNGQQVIAGDSGVYSMIQTKEKLYSTLHLLKSPSVKIKGTTIEIKNILYGEEKNRIKEEWRFVFTKEDIKLSIDRYCSAKMTVEKEGSPVFTFDNMDTWDGAYQDYGGLAWFYLFNRKLDNYGVHSKSSKFWNAQTGNGLAIEADAGGSKIATDYNRTESDKLVCNIAVSHNDFIPRFDPGTNRRRFIRDTSAWVWAPFPMQAGRTSQSVTLSYFNFEQKYGRGILMGINQKQVSDVLNTIARIGVIDKYHFGGNSWHTPYGPICLHEQYIAQLGLAINDTAYLSGYRDCLDFYCDKAIKPDGRVWPRWAYTNEDAMPGEVNAEGFYEAQWGFLLDSNPDLVTNIAELYDQTGDLGWVKMHQQTCEHALDWILQRDSDHNGLVEMMTDSTAQKRGSDWIDIIWASYENAFVNAKLYHALVLWAAIEKQLGNIEKEKYYTGFARKLKTAFNQPTTKGGFWDEENKCYIHWRDKGGSLHGRNMVTPVNFMAIGYDICDDETRKKIILDNIEMQMQKENLFFWPLCMYSYAPGEGNDWQFPFPRYENGDLFLSWGAIGVKAYASYRPELALKYVKNILDQYAKDGLAFQRYGRRGQNGLGDDILAGNSLAVVGLYQAIYGINPLYNRFYLNPHITPELAGTQLKYQYRKQLLTIDLSTDQYSVSDGRFKIISKEDFGFYSKDNTLLYFKGNNDIPSLKIISSEKNDLTLEIKRWNDKECLWWQESAKPSNMLYEINNLDGNSSYTILVNNQPVKKVVSNREGKLVFDYHMAQKRVHITVARDTW